MGLENFVYIGLVGALGVDLKKVEAEIKKALAVYDYKIHPIRVSSIISAAMGKDGDLDFDSEADRIEKFMNWGDELREYGAAGDFAATLSIAEISIARERYEKNIAFVVRSFKTPEEIAIFRDVYGKFSWVISIFQSATERAENLAKQIASSETSHDVNGYRLQAKALIERDKMGGKGKFGQNVGSAFQHADFFIDGSSNVDIAPQIQRSVDLIFGDPFKTPTRDEQGMYFAHAASLRSADLSRQVGAVISADRGEVIATGCNEVPRVGGDAFWAGDDPVEDNRDYTKGSDPNVAMKAEMMEEFIDALIDSGLMSGNDSGIDSKIVISRLLYGEGGYVPSLKSTLAANILEFGRVVHAEMSALSQAARIGRPVAGATLYCTTFPCHGCARHIIASGILRVVFIEPYEKSKVFPLYGGEIKIDTKPACGMVRFSPFSGVAPRRYAHVFRSGERKRKRGHVVEWPPTDPRPNAEIFPSYSFNEKAIKARLTGVKIPLVNAQQDPE